MKSNLLEKTMLIEGMTCVNCENKIERKLKETKGITKVSVSYATAKATFSYDAEEICLQDIETIIEAMGYRKQVATQETKKKTDVFELLCIGVIVFGLYRIMGHLGVLGIFNEFPQAKVGMGYGMLFVIGLLTSIHCIAMCGGINLSQCIPQNKGASLRPTFLYNLGRVISYTVIGGIVGTVGSVISFSGTAKGLVQLFAGVFMVIMGINILNLFPGLRKFNLRMPKVFAQKLNANKQSRGPLYVGLLNGLMPCGPLQTMQLYALSTGSFLAGAFSMFLFSLGTVPLMFGLGALSGILTKKFTQKMMTVSAVMVILLGIFMFNSGMSLSGLSFSSATSSVTKNEEVTEYVPNLVDGVQVITTTLSSRGYEPITVQKGVPVKWIMTAEESAINGCNNTIIVPEYDLTWSLAPGENVIEFMPSESGVIPFSCWMGMIRSNITVVE